MQSLFFPRAMFISVCTNLSLFCVIICHLWYVSRLFCMMTIYTATTENCFAPMVVMHTLFPTRIALFLFDTLFNTYLLLAQSHCYQVSPLAQSCNYRALYMSTIGTTRDYTSKCLNVLYCGLNSSIIIFANMRRSRLFLHAVCTQKGHGRCTFSSKIIIIREGQVILPTRFLYQLEGKGSSQI